MAKRLLIIFALCVTAFAVKAQTQTQIDSAKAESNRLVALYHQLDGTYQIQVINSRDKVEIPLQYMDNVAQLRKQNEVTYYYYPNKPNVRIMILPYSQITSPDFVPVQQIAYVTQ